MQVAERDQYSVQRGRVERIVNELAPGKRVEFDEESTLHPISSSRRRNSSEPL
jgi:hypothetical protein